MNNRRRLKNKQPTRVIITNKSIFSSQISFVASFTEVAERIRNNIFPIAYINYVKKRVFYKKMKIKHIKTHRKHIKARSKL